MTLYLIHWGLISVPVMFNVFLGNFVTCNIPKSKPSMHFFFKISDKTPWKYRQQKSEEGMGFKETKQFVSKVQTKSQLLWVYISYFFFLWLMYLAKSSLLNIQAVSFLDLKMLFRFEISASCLHSRFAMMTNNVCKSLKQSNNF